MTEINDTLENKRISLAVKDMKWIIITLFTLISTSIGGFYMLIRRIDKQSDAINTINYQLIKMEVTASTTNIKLETANEKLNTLEIDNAVLKEQIKNLSK